MVRLYTDNPTLMNGAYVRKTSDMELESLGETLDYVNLYPSEESRQIHIFVLLMRQEELQEHLTAEVLA